MASLGSILNEVKYLGMRTVLKLRRNPGKIQDILKQAGVQKNMKILDYGCGIGSYTIEAAKLTGKTGKVVAADINAKMIEEVKKQQETEHLSNITPLLITSMEEIQESNFDVIFLIDMLHFVEDPLKTIEFMFGKLSKKGKLLVKFEHFSQEQMNSLLASIKCSEKQLLYKKYWLLSR